MITNTKKFIKIVADEIPPDPRKRKDFIKFSTIICGHKRYKLGDIQANSEEEFNKKIKEIEKSSKIIFKGDLYLLDRGGLWMRINQDFDNVDPGRSNWGWLGYIIVTKEDLERADLKPTKRNAKKIAEDEIAIYNQYLEGDVWQIDVYEKCPTCGQNNVVYCLAGIYGYDRAVKTAKKIFPNAEILENT